MNPSDPRQQELADFLKSLRERCKPSAFGFPEGQRRRTAGLRREEVAQLAGISPTWYTWIEQGRKVQMSTDVLDRLAIALKMERSQRVYLFELAGKRDPFISGNQHGIDPEILQKLVTTVTGPAYVLGRHWDVLAWNTAAKLLFHDWLGVESNPNLMRYVFLNPRAKEIVCDWENRARRLVAEFRADCSAHLEDIDLSRLIQELTQNSVEFARYWKQHDVLERQGGSREFNHPEKGLLTFQQMTLQLVDQEQLKLVVLL